MTLIAAFRSPQGIALCADSQETVTQSDENGQPYEMRVTIQKIEPITFGKYQIAIAGAGNASLIEAFIERAKRGLQDQDTVVCTRENPATVLAVRDRLEAELARFYANDVTTCPDIDKSFQLFIAGCCPIAQQFAFWISENAVLRESRADRPELIGWEHGLYSETANRLFSRNMNLPQAVLASIYTLTIAKDSSNYVRDPFSVAVITKDGISMQDEDYVKSMEGRLGDYEAALNRLFLACSDTTVSVPDLEDKIDEFKKTSIDLHRNHIDSQASRMTLGDAFTGRLPKLPPGPNYFGARGITVEHDRQKINESRKRREQMKAMAGAGPIVFTIHCKYKGDFDVELANIQELFQRGRFPCPKCGAVKDAKKE